MKIKKNSHWIHTLSDTLWVFEKKHRLRGYVGKIRISQEALRFFCLTGPNKGIRRDVSKENFRTEFKRAEKEEVGELLRKERSQIIVRDKGIVKPESKIIQQQS